MQNRFPMKEWHVEHMQKTIIKYVKGLPENASAFEKRNHKKYGGLNHICRQIEYDIRHGVTEKEVASTLQKVRNHSSYSEIRKGSGSMERLKEVEVRFASPRIEFQQEPW